MHLQIPHARSVELSHLTGGPCITQRLIEADRGAERLREAGMADQLVRREGLLDIEQLVLVESAQVGLMLGPEVTRRWRPR